MRNKVVVSSLVLLILIASFIAVQNPVRGTTSGDYAYTLIDNGMAAQITAYNGNGGTVTVPGTIDGHPVTSIGDFAFYECTTMTSVVIPDGVTDIGESAFYNCTSLSSVTLPASVTAIDKQAFCGCSALASITLPGHLASVGDLAFCSTGLTSIVLPETVNSLGNSVFQDCQALNSVTLPQGLKAIGSGEFAHCSGLSALIIPAGVISIGDGAFYDCTALSAIVIPDNVTSISFSAFNDCTSLRSFIIPDSVTDIGYGAFYGCDGITSLQMGSGVTSISALTFSGCRSLSSFDVPDNVGSIGYSAFYNCTSLASVVIGSGVTAIGVSAFGNCSSLTSITFRSDQPTLASGWVSGHGSGLTVRYYEGASGFTTPSWEGLPAEMWSTLAAPQGLAVVTGIGSVSVSWSALNGNGSGAIDYYIVYQDGADVRHVSSGTEVSISGLANGHRYSFQVAAHSAAGAGLNSSALVVVPDPDPNWMRVNITSPQDRSFLDSGNLTVSWTVGTGSAVDHLNLYLDGGAPARLPADARNYSLVGLTEGAHSVNVTAVDGLGITTFKTVSFTVDLTAPTIIRSSPNGNALSTRSPVVVMFSESMDQNTTGIVLVGVTGSTVWNGSVATFAPASTLVGNTSYVVHVTGADRAGNRLDSMSWTFTTANVGTVSGQINDGAGRPIANATVTLKRISSATNNTAVEPATSTVTDGNGSYAFYDMTAGDYLLTVAKEGYGTATVNVSMTAEGIANGGVTASAVINSLPSSSGVMQAIEIAAIAGAVALVLLGAVLFRRRNKKEEGKGK